MEEFSSSEVCRRGIPGLPDSADKNKKGKKKGRDKKTVTLQSFLQQEGGEGGEGGEADTMEQHFAKLNLDEEELIVMESCHRCSVTQESERFTTIQVLCSYIHDLLRQMGPTNAMDPRLQTEINNFPPEAKRVIQVVVWPRLTLCNLVPRLQKCGGYRNFILRSKELAVVDKIVAARADLINAQEIAFNEIYNSLPLPAGRNENVNTGEQQKEVWNKPSLGNKPEAVQYYQVEHINISLAM